jgi:hypothetical protein
MSVEKAGTTRDGEPEPEPGVFGPQEPEAEPSENARLFAGSWLLKKM